MPDSDALRSHLYNLRKAVDKPFPEALIHYRTRRGLMNRTAALVISASINDRIGTLGRNILTQSLVIGFASIAGVGSGAHAGTRADQGGVGKLRITGACSRKMRRRPHPILRI